MPNYEFQCTNCQRGIEVIQAYSAPNPVCPECGGETKRKMSVVNFTFGFVRSWDRHDGKGDRLVRNISGV
ncbi:FmdB family zinc ribbon protein [Chloroflexota bacterium]